MNTSSYAVLALLIIVVAVFMYLSYMVVVHQWSPFGELSGNRRIQIRKQYEQWRWEQLMERVDAGELSRREARRLLKDAMRKYDGLD